MHSEPFAQSLRTQWHSQVICSVNKWLWRLIVKVSFLRRVGHWKTCQIITVMFMLYNLSYIQSRCLCVSTQGCIHSSNPLNPIQPVPTNELRLRCLQRYHQLQVSLAVSQFSGWILWRPNAPASAAEKCSLYLLSTRARIVLKTTVHWSAVEAIFFN